MQASFLLACLLPRNASNLGSFLGTFLPKFRWHGAGLPEITLATFLPSDSIDGMNPGTRPPLLSGACLPACLSCPLGCAGAGRQSPSFRLTHLWVRENVNYASSSVVTPGACRGVLNPCQRAASTSPAAGYVSDQSAASSSSTGTCRPSPSPGNGASP